MDHTFVEVVEQSSAVVPNGVALLLGGAVFATRGGRNMLCFTVALLGMLVVSWFVPLIWVAALLPVVMCAASAIDQRKDPRFQMNRKAFWVLLVLLATMQGYILTRSEGGGPTILELGEGEMVVSRGARYQVVLPRSGLRIVEFSQAPSREWHLKDGTHVVSVSEGDQFVAANGETWLARDIVADVEQWAGIHREHTNRNP